MIVTGATGDSIAVGVAQALHLPIAAVSARVGASSAEIVRMTRSQDGRHVVISAGSNDPTNPRLVANLEAIRRKLGNVSVVWILPRHSLAAAAVVRVCARHRDTMVNLADFRSRDGVHPSSYRAVARATNTPRSCIGA